MHAIKSYRESGDITPLVLKIGTGWM